MRDHRAVAARAAVIRGGPRASEAQPDALSQLRDGTWVRPHTYDARVVAEAEGYLALEPLADDVLLDVGANIGAVSRAFMRAGVRRVVAVEPEPANFELLTRNTAAYDGAVVRLRAAVAGTPARRTLWLNPIANAGMHSTVIRRSGHGIPVACRTLTDLFAEYRPTLVKIDIEGGEYELADELAALPSHVRGVALELHFASPAWRHADGPRLVRALASQGFAAVRPPDMADAVGTVGIWLRS